MRDFASSSRASQLPLPAKVLYTAFAALNLAGLVSSVVLYDAMVDFNARATPAQLYERLIAHYGRDPGVYQHLLEVTHAHLFSVSVLLLVAGHLFLLTGASPRLKLWLIVTGVAGVVLHLSAPWIVYLGHGAFGSGLIYPASGLLMLLSLGVMTGVPVWEMWRRPISGS